MDRETRARLTPKLETGLAALSLDPALAGPLLDYLGLLLKWNRAYNLTAIRDADEMVSLHLLDSLSVHPYLRGERILDVGTGPGLPGIPLALANPERGFTLLDSVGKKTRFLQQAVMTLELGNVTVVQSRIEAHRPAEGYTSIVSRAFASLEEMAQKCRHCLTEGGVMLAMKGLYPATELESLPEGLRVEAVKELRVPGLSAARHLVIIKSNQFEHGE